MNNIEKRFSAIMSKATFGVLVTSLILIVGCSDAGSDREPTHKSSSSTWNQSYAKAVAQSKDSGKPIFAFFTGSDWCGWCKVLDSQILNTPTFVKWANENVVLLELDFPTKYKQDPAIIQQNQQLKRMYDVKGYPTILVLTADGKPLIKTGYKDVTPEVWVETLGQAIKQASLKDQK